MLTTLRRNTLHKVNPASVGVCVNEAHYRLVGEPAAVLKAFKTCLASCFSPSEKMRFPGLDAILAASDHQSDVSTLGRQLHRCKGFPSIIPLFVAVLLFKKGFYCVFS